MKLNEVVGEDADIAEKLSAAGITDVEALSSSLESDEKREALLKSGFTAGQLDEWQEKIDAGGE